MIRVRIAGTGSYLPVRVLTNQDLERIVDTNEEWIVTRTGIRERRITAEGEASSSLAVNAAQRALAMAGVSPEVLDVIVVDTVTPDMFFPSVGCLVQDALGAKRAAAFDLSAGCSGFIYALTVAESFMTRPWKKSACSPTCRATTSRCCRSCWWDSPSWSPGSNSPPCASSPSGSPPATT